MVHILMLVIGCCIGSFINVILSRSDWYRGRSICDHCKYQLKWYDLIPVISFICLGGRCRKCREKIELSHFMSELLMGGAFLCSSFMTSINGIWYGITCFLTLFFMALAAIEDYKEQAVYSWILNASIIVAYILKTMGYIIFMNYQSAAVLLVSVLLLKGTAIVLAKVLKERLGAGDFDILITMYILCGIYGAVLSVTIACILGCLIYLPQIMMKKRDKYESLPFIPLLFAGTICTLLM